jgi:hypothetical protein
VVFRAFRLLNDEEVLREQLPTPSTASARASGWSFSSGETRAAGAAKIICRDTLTIYTTLL